MAEFEVQLLNVQCPSINEKYPWYKLELSGSCTECPPHEWYPGNCSPLSGFAGARFRNEQLAAVAQASHTHVPDTQSPAREQSQAVLHDAPPDLIAAAGGAADVGEASATGAAKGAAKGAAGDAAGDVTVEDQRHPVVLGQQR